MGGLTTARFTVPLVALAADSCELCVMSLACDDVSTCDELRVARDETEADEGEVFDVDSPSDVSPLRAARRV